MSDIAGYLFGVGQSVASSAANVAASYATPENLMTAGKVAAGAATTVVASQVAVAAVPVVLGAVGFSSPGIVAGSWAAAVQSSIGCVSQGSTFASLMSAGATGTVSTGVATAIQGAVYGTAFGLWGLAKKIF